MLDGDPKDLLAIARGESLRFRLSGPDREDLAQDAVVAILECRGRLDDSRCLAERRGYMKAVARNKMLSCLRLSRRLDRNASLPEAIRLHGEAAACPEDEVWARQLDGILGRVLELTEKSLTVQQNDVFRACIYDEPLPPSWAGVSTSTFSWHAAQVRRAIREAAKCCGAEAEVDTRGHLFTLKKCRIAVG